MAEKFDLLVYLLLIGAALGGWRKGFVREALVFVIWVPAVYAIVSIMINNFSPTDGMSAEAQGALKYIGWMFMGAWVVVALADALFLKPALRDAHDPSVLYLNKSAGVVFGIGRVFALIVVGMAMFDIYVRPLDDVQVVQRSEVLKVGRHFARDFVHYLRDKGYVSNEVTLYDHAKEQERKVREQYDDIVPELNMFNRAR
jgi:uncharacterized membrane protein required for colicin V production